MTAALRVFVFGDMDGAMVYRWAATAGVIPPGGWPATGTPWVDQPRAWPFPCPGPLARHAPLAPRPRVV